MHIYIYISYICMGNVIYTCIYIYVYIRHVDIFIWVLLPAPRAQEADEELGAMSLVTTPCPERSMVGKDLSSGKALRINCEFGFEP